MWEVTPQRPGSNSKEWEETGTKEGIGALGGVSMRRLWVAIGVLACLLTVSGMSRANMSDGMLTVEVTVGEAFATVEGANVGLDQPPVLFSGRTFVPFRVLGQALGASVAWDGKLSQVTASFDQTRVVLTVGSAAALVNGQPTTLDAPARLIGGRVLVPLRFLAEAFGWEVAWNATTRTATVRRPSREWDFDLTLNSATRSFALPSLDDAQWLRYETEPGVLYAATMDGDDAWALTARLCDATREVVSWRVNGFEDPESDWSVDEPSFLFRVESAGPYYFEVWTVLEGYCPRMPSDPYGIRIATPTPLSLGQTHPVAASPTGVTVHQWFSFEAKAGKSYRVETSSGSDDIALYGPEPDFEFVDHAAAPTVRGAAAGTYYVATGASEAYTITVTQLP